MFSDQKKKEKELGALLSIDAGKRELVKFECPQPEPTRAIYYGVFFRDGNGRPQIATDSFYAERKRAEGVIERFRVGKVKGMGTDYFIATLSVPVSAKEAGKCSARI